MDRGALVFLFLVVGCAEKQETLIPPDAAVGTDCVDRDRDGYGEGAACRGPDCDDTNPNVNPTSTEVCDGLDNNCNGAVDDNLLAPDCARTRGVCAGSRQRCVDGAWAECSGTASYGLFYEMTELACDREDNDCDGFVDEACPCEPGDTQDCGVAEGACQPGTQVCTAGGMWGPCLNEVGPAPEACDGQDNDCDGTLDEDIEPQRCALTVGVCAGSRASCGVGGFAECGAAEYGPDWVAEEGAANCDAEDNDCDGRVDEGCGCEEGEEQACGSDVGACQRGLQACTAGAWGECRGGTMPVDEACNGADDDCDGNTDEQLEAPACAKVLGLCAGATQACGAGGFTPCDDATYLFHDDRYVPNEGPGDCDRLDNDCDGAIDEACDCEEGAEQACGQNVGACTQGTQTCVGGRFTPCDGVGPADERCNGIDDDCDGPVDEGIVGAQCPLQIGVCAGAREACVEGEIVPCGRAAYGPLYEEEESRCDQLDNDCDGDDDEGCVCSDGEVQACGTDEGECARGDQTCVNGAWAACEGAVVPGVEACDGLDNDCDGDSDEALQAPPCPLQVGVCAGALQVCPGAAGWPGVCGADEYGAAWVADEGADHCDGRDNDCDGQTDEGCECNPEAEPAVCGSAVGACETGLLRCEAGQITGCEGEVAPAPESCDGRDEDCDGSTDEDLEPPACDLVEGVCAGAVKRCDGDRGWGPCGRIEYGAAYDPAEPCDGLDNDCDGSADEMCPPPPVVISEILYDGPGADGPNEFIELAGPPGYRLNGMVLEAVNGNDGEVYERIPLAGQRIAFDGYFVIVEDADGVLRDIADMVAAGADLQNGPDSLRLLWNGEVIDAVGYGDFADLATFAGEGSPAPDAVEASLSRDGDNTDTNDNSADFVVLETPTPGGQPLPRIHLALRWATDGTDFDLHMQREGAGWESDDDCYWRNRTPPWGPNGERGDPRLDRDDQDGLGPEFIDYVNPPAGRYTVQVEYFQPVMPSDATVGIFIDGALAESITRRIDAAAPYWVPAEIVVGDDGAIAVEVFDEADANPF